MRLTHPCIFLEGGKENWGDKRIYGTICEQNTSNFWMSVTMNIYIFMV
jgi:hypothetical protein